MLCGIVPSLVLQAWVNVLQILSEGRGPEQRCIAGAGVFCWDQGVATVLVVRERHQCSVSHGIA